MTEKWKMHFLMITIISVNWLLRRQSLDSSCDMVCLKERIQKSQEEREKREERLLQTHTLQQTGNLPQQITR